MSGILSFLLLALSGLMGQEAPREPKYIHVIVALCDNEHQGIVPVPEKLGNGRAPADNLYWGARYGVQSCLKNHPGWRQVGRAADPPPPILERLIFQRKDAPIFLVAEAYDGAAVKQALEDFLSCAAGLRKTEIPLEGARVKAGGAADLICYVGHNGLMDFSLESSPLQADPRKRQAIILACASKAYFASHLKRTGATPLLWTTGLMSPEAYTLTAAVEAWIGNETPDIIREKAAQAYNLYQKCGIEGAKRLFVTGY